jgi:hypothetical protein
MDPLFGLRIESAKIWNDGWGRCLEPHWECTDRPIKAHSIQNARILDGIARDGHVVMLSPAYHPTKPPLPEFRSVGRGKATTFEGLCGPHDMEIFKRIDAESIETNDEEQLFLLAYRATTRELHTTMAVAYKAQMSDQEAVKLGLSPGDRPCDHGMFAVERMAVAWDTYRYRLQFDEDLIAGRYEGVHHRVIEIECSQPSLAVSSLFSVDSVRSGDDCLLLSLSVLPLEDTNSVAIFSWRREEDPAAESWLADQFTSGLSAQAMRQRVSLIVLANCENFVLTPALVERMSEQDKNRLLKFYLTTTFAVDEGSEDINVDFFL